MTGGPYITYFEITGTTPTEADMASALAPLDARKALFLLARMNLHFRLAASSPGVSFQQAIGRAQQFLFINFLDEEIFEQIKAKFSGVKTSECVLFHPFQILNVMRCVLKYCQGQDEADGVTDSQRYAVGRSCLMANDLLSTEVDNERLIAGSDDIRRAEFMVQLLPSFEATNPGSLRSLLYRSLGAFSMLLSDGPAKAEILKRSNGYDFAQRFAEKTGTTLERWIAILFTFIAYYNQYGRDDGSQQNYTYLWIDPRVYIGESKISANDLQTVLGIVSATPEDLSLSFSSNSAARQSTNLTPMKCHPLVRIGELFICNDLGFLTEKLFAGAYWTLHNLDEGRKDRDRLASAWGRLFEEYVNWWADGRAFPNGMTFHRFPVWHRERKRNAQKIKGPGEEAFDGLIVHGRRLVALEYKGGFLRLDAKYSLNLRLLLRDLNKKIAKGCRQLARNIGRLFAINPGRQLESIPTKQITRIIPVIVVQDQSLRSVGINWWINRQFQREMRREVLRPELTVEPITLIHIDEFETMIDSAEGPDFDFIGTIQLRNLRDPEGMTDLKDCLINSNGYGRQHSSRRMELEEEFNRCVMKYTFES